MAIFPSENSLSAFGKAKNMQQDDITGMLKAQTGKADSSGIGGQQTQLKTYDTGTPEIEQAIRKEQQKTAFQGVQQEQAKAAQQQQAGQQQSQLKEKALTVKTQLKDQTEELLQKFEQQRDLLDLDRYKSEVEQIGFNLRMQNTKYIDQLKLEGARARLDNKAKFAEALAGTVYGDEMDLLKNDLAFKRMSGLSALASQRSLEESNLAFQKELGEMNLEQALKLAAADSDARNTAMQYSAIGDIINLIPVLVKGYGATQKTSAKTAQQIYGETGEH